MARSTRTSRLETRTARLELAIDRRHAITIAQGLILVYRRGPASSTRYAKIKQRDGTYRLERLGSADDHEDGNGVDVLD